MILISGRTVVRNVMSMATGEAPAEFATPELPEIVKTIKEAKFICPLNAKQVYVFSLMLDLYNVV